jgi:hypothetical protein
VATSCRLKINPRALPPIRTSSKSFLKSTFRTEATTKFLARTDIQEKRSAAYGRQEDVGRRRILDLFGGHVRGQQRDQRVVVSISLASDKAGGVFSVQPAAPHDSPIRFRSTV